MGIMYSNFNIAIANIILSITQCGVYFQYSMVRSFLTLKKKCLEWRSQRKFFFQILMLFYANGPPKTMLATHVIYKNSMYFNILKVSEINTSALGSQVNSIEGVFFPHWFSIQTYTHSKLRNFLPHRSYDPKL